MTFSIEERAHAAAMLRAIAPEFPEHRRTGMAQPSWPTLSKALGTATRRETVERVASLIDPTPWANTVEDNHRLLERCRKLERENARLKAHVRALELFNG